MNQSYALTSMAESDLADILDYTIVNFGYDQAYLYSTKLEECIVKLVSKGAPNVRILNMSGVIECLRCGQHYIFARRRENEKLLILAVFHEKMDLMERLSSRLLNL